jgi:hypothetical protein
MSLELYSTCISVLQKFRFFFSLITEIHKISNFDFTKILNLVVGSRMFFSLCTYM